MPLRRSWCAIHKKPSRTQPPRWPVGHAAARSPKSGTARPPTPSRIWSAPRCAANSNPRAAAARFPPAADTHRFEEAEEVKAVKKVKKVKEVKDSGVAAPRRGAISPLPILYFIYLTNPLYLIS